MARGHPRQRIRERRGVAGEEPLRQVLAAHQRAPPGPGAGRALARAGRPHRVTHPREAGPELDLAATMATERLGDLAGMRRVVRDQPPDDRLAGMELDPPGPPPLEPPREHPRGPPPAAPADYVPPPPDPPTHPPRLPPPHHILPP